MLKYADICDFRGRGDCRHVTQPTHPPPQSPAPEVMMPSRWGSSTMGGTLSRWHYEPTSRHLSKHPLHRQPSGWTINPLSHAGRIPSSKGVQARSRSTNRHTHSALMAPPPPPRVDACPMAHQLFAPVQGNTQRPPRPTCFHADIVLSKRSERAHSSLVHMSRHISTRADRPHSRHGRCCLQLHGCVSPDSISL